MVGKGKNAQSENLLFCTDRIEGGEGNETRRKIAFIMETTR